MGTDLIPLALLRSAETYDNARGFFFVGEDGEIEKQLSFSRLVKEAARVAAALRRAGLKPGERVGLILPDNFEFITAFFGAMHGGFVPVPLAPPMNVGKLTVFLEQLRHIASHSGMSLLLVTDRIKPLLGSLLGGPLHRICTYRELETDDEELPVADIRPDSLAFIQFTSGSTSKPKGVALSHENLRANVKCIVKDGIGVRSEDVSCSWLPLFHDMGLIGLTICPAAIGTPVYLTSPLSFIRRPAIWLKMMSRFHGSISFGPNFAYGLCTKRIKEAELDGVDLSRWRVAGCGAEPVQEKTLRAFAERFSSAGFRDSAFYPTYGMAESTLAVTFPPVGRGMKVDPVNSEELAHRRLAVPDEQSALRIVSCGSPFPDHELALLEGEEIHRREREVGEIVIKGPSVMRGYYNNDEANREAFKDGWLRTGDLGYLASGELYICGRQKEIIIVSGKNYYPTDIEALLTEVEGVRKGNVVAFGLSDVARGEESIVICAESTADSSRYEEIEKAVRAKVLEGLAIHVGEVVLLPPNTLPKTSSGKLQRTKTKQLFLEEQLGGSSLTKEKLEFIKHWALSQWSYLRKRR